MWPHGQRTSSGVEFIALGETPQTQRTTPYRAPGGDLGGTTKILIERQTCFTKDTEGATPLHSAKLCAPRPLMGETRPSLPDKMAQKVRCTAPTRETEKHAFAEAEATRNNDIRCTTNTGKPAEKRRVSRRGEQLREQTCHKLWRVLLSISCSEAAVHHAVNT